MSMEVIDCVPLTFRHSNKFNVVAEVVRGKLIIVDFWSAQYISRCRINEAYVCGKRAIKYYIE